MKKLVSNKVYLGKNGLKYVIGYKDGIKFKPLCVMLPKMSTYRRDFDVTKYMSVLIKNGKLLGKYNEIWDKFSNYIKNEFDREPIYKEKYRRAKVKSCEGKISTNFHGDKVLKEGSPCIRLSVIIIILIEHVKSIVLKYF